MAYGKLNQYTAQVLSINAEVYKIDSAKFAKKFGHVLPDLKEMVLLRNKFIYERLNKQAKFHLLMNHLKNIKKPK